MNVAITMNMHATAILYRVHKGNWIPSCAILDSGNSIFLLGQIDYLLITKCIWIWACWSCTTTYVRMDAHKCHGYLGSRALTFAKVRWHNLHGPLLTLLVNRLYGAILTPRSSQHTSPCVMVCLWFSWRLLGNCHWNSRKKMGGIAQNGREPYICTWVLKMKVDGVAQVMKCSDSSDTVLWDPLGITVLSGRISNCILRMSKEGRMSLWGLHKVN